MENDGENNCSVCPDGRHIDRLTHRTIAGFWDFVLGVMRGQEDK